MHVYSNAWIPTDQRFNACPLIFEISTWHVENAADTQVLQQVLVRLIVFHDI